MLADGFALLQARPDAVGSAVVGNAGGRTDTGAGVANEMARARQPVGQLLRFGVAHVQLVFLLEEALLGLVNAVGEFARVLGDAGRGFQQRNLVGGALGGRLAQNGGDLCEVMDLVELNECSE